MAGEPVTIKDNISMIWVKCNWLDPETFQDFTFGDVFVVTPQLPLFAADPQRYFPEGITPNKAYVFGLYEDFAAEVAPYILKLNEQGAT